MRQCLNQVVVLKQGILEMDTVLSLGYHQVYK